MYLTYQISFCQTFEGKCSQSSRLSWPLGVKSSCSNSTTSVAGSGGFEEENFLRMEIDVMMSPCQVWSIIMIDVDWLMLIDIDTVWLNEF